MQQLLGRGLSIVKHEHPYLPVEDVGQQFAVGRDGGLMALGQQARFAALGADDPQLLLRALGEPGWIRHRMVLALSVTAADVNDLCGVWCPLWGRYLLAVVLGIARDLAGDVAVAIRGGFGYPQIAPAADVRHPGQTPLGRRGA